jgi:hypothetical protein
LYGLWGGAPGPRGRAKSKTHGPFVERNQNARPRREVDAECPKKLTKEIITKKFVQKILKSVCPESARNLSLEPLH